MTDPLYLDYNASAPLRPEVRDAMTAAFDLYGNPSSVHRFGREAQARVENARAQVAALAGASPEQVIFTSGGTEANNLALTGVHCATILTSAIEHDSVLAAPSAAARLPVDRNGVVKIEPLAHALANASRPALVSVMLANNETGVVQPIQRIADVVRAADGLLHCDAVQAAGRLPLDAATPGIDLLSLSAHKIGGPKGVGALILLADTDIAPQLHGGGQERRRRAGTENVAGIIGFGVAAQIAAAEASNRSPLDQLQERLETRIRAAVPTAVVYASSAERLPNTSCIGLPGVGSEVQVMNLDLAGIAVSAGAACSSGKVSPSHVLRAMGVTAHEAACAIRVSTGWGTVSADIDSFVDAWTAMAARLLASHTEAVAA